MANTPLEIVNEMLIAWMKTLRSSCSDNRYGNTGITCEPVTPLTSPVVKPTGISRRLASAVGSLNAG